MTDEEKLRAELHEVYERHDLDENGLYLSRDVCTRPCCYDGIQIDDEIREDVDRAIKDSFGGAYSDYFVGSFGPMEYPSIERIVKHIKVKSCNHAMILKGSSSATTSGPMDIFECTKCGRAEYRKPAGREAL